MTNNSASRTMLKILFFFVFTITAPNQALSQNISTPKLQSSNIDWWKNGFGAFNHRTYAFVLESRGNQGLYRNDNHIRAETSSDTIRELTGTLIDAGAVVRVMSDPTRIEVIDTLLQLRKIVEPNDQLIFIYSGDYITDDIWSTTGYIPTIDIDAESLLHDGLSIERIIGYLERFDTKMILSFFEIENIGFYSSRDELDWRSANDSMDVEGFNGFNIFERELDVLSRYSKFSIVGQVKVDFEHGDISIVDSLNDVIRSVGQSGSSLSSADLLRSVRSKITSNSINLSFVEDRGNNNVHEWIIMDQSLADRTVASENVEPFSNTWSHISIDSMLPKDRIIQLTDSFQQDYLALVSAWSKDDLIEQETSYQMYKYLRNEEKLRKTVDSDRCYPWFSELITELEQTRREIVITSNNSVATETADQRNVIRSAYLVQDIFYSAPSSCTE